MIIYDKSGDKENDDDDDDDEDDDDNDDGNLVLALPKSTLNVTIASTSW